MIEKVNKRPKVAIILDYGLRNPNFAKIYTEFKKLLLQDGDEVDLDLSGLEGSGGWMDVRRNREMMEFYTKTPVPLENEHFDITWRKYFFNAEHRLKFLLEYAYGLFGQGGAISKVDVNNINLAQTHLFDIVLIDRLQHSRKIMNTMGFLSRIGIVFKELRFVSSDEEIAELEKEMVGIYNPYKNPKQIIFLPSQQKVKIKTEDLTEIEKEDEELKIQAGEEEGTQEIPTESLLSFLMECEKTVKKEASLKENK